MNKENTKYRTVVISDVHIGAPHSKYIEATDFLSSVDCETLILDGDIIDGWQLNLDDDNTEFLNCDFFQVIFNKIHEKNTKVIYVTGNHDDFLDPLVPFEYYGIKIVSKYILKSINKNYAVIHGHAFDAVSQHFRWVSKLGDIAYNLLIKFNKIWNKSRKSRGKEAFSLSKIVKHKVKQAVNYISGFESHLSDYAKSIGCQGIICGHIHRVEDKTIKDGIHYLNSGDWVESMTALVEDFDGNWAIVKYSDWK